MWHAGRASREAIRHARAYRFLYVHGLDIRAQQWAAPCHLACRRGGGHTETIMASIGDSPNITCHCLGFRVATSILASMSMCRRRHVRICTCACMGDASPRRRRHVVHVTAYAHAVRSPFLSVTDIYTSTSLLHD